jgi:hypothetical protein
MALLDIFEHQREINILFSEKEEIDKKITNFQTKIDEKVRIIANSRKEVNFPILMNIESTNYLVIQKIGSIDVQFQKLNQFPSNDDE